jgi:hypothetical protein
VLPGRYRLSGVGNPDATDAIYDRIAAKLCTLKNQIAERISSLAHQIVQDEFNFFFATAFSGSGHPSAYTTTRPSHRRWLPEIDESLNSSRARSDKS